MPSSALAGSLRPCFRMSTTEARAGVLVSEPQKSPAVSVDFKPMILPKAIVSIAETTSP